MYRAYGVFISAGLKKMTKVIIPGAVIITFLINIALPTAAGCAAAVGALLIPALIRSGVHSSDWQVPLFS